MKTALCAAPGLVDSSVVARSVRQEQRRINNPSENSRAHGNGNGNVDRWKQGVITGATDESHKARVAMAPAWEGKIDKEKR